MPIDSGGYFDHTPQSTGQDFRRQAITMLEAMGISVEFSHHEGAPGQQEIDLRYADALTTADNIMTFRLVVKEVALEQGVWATFMPKPFADHPGSGMHTHLSLFEGDRNAFYEAGAEYQLSKIGRSFIAGLLAARAGDHRGHQPVGQLATSGSDGGGEAPRRTSAGATTTAPRWSACRCTSPARAQSTRIELRSHRHRLQPLPRLRRHARRRPQGHRGGLRAAARRRGRRVVAAPSASAARWASSRCRRTSARRSRLMERCELVAETLGEHVFDFFLRNKRAEWEEYRAQVTAFERDRYLPVL